MRGYNMEKVKLWTTQDGRVLKEIEEKGVYRAKLGSIVQKYDTCSDIYLNVYRWFSKAADSVVPRPQGVEFPVWAAFEKEFSFGLIEGQVRLELEVDRENVIIFDSGKWDYILNYWYIPADSRDKEEYDRKLESLGIKNRSLICMTNFYPTLKREVESSWHRLFDPSISISGLDQAVLWEIRPEWIKNITFP
jgi:hypothetical protein